MSVTLALVLLLPIALLFLRQRQFIYHPQRYGSDYARALPIGAKELVFRTAAGAQAAFFVPVDPNRTGPPDRIWVVFPGNASAALDWLYLPPRDPVPGDAFLLVDYPGYGKCEGRATIKSTRASADKALETLASAFGVQTEVLESRLGVIGQSLGAAAALDFAAKHPVRNAVLIAPFTTLRDVAALLVTRPLSYLLLENYDNRARLRELASRPVRPRVLILHGTADTLIPISMSRKLANEFPQIVQLQAVDGATHDDILLRADDRLVSWLRDSSTVAP
jgi:pimeloyl-ACP methyl ester carboxylesterase